MTVVSDVSEIVIQLFEINQDINENTVIVNKISWQCDNILSFLFMDCLRQ